MPAIDAAATIDAVSGPIGITRLLDTAPRTATAWEWTLIRRPPGSTAKLSSSSVENPTFTPDAADLFVFRLKTSTSGGARISTRVRFRVSTISPEGSDALNADPLTSLTSTGNHGAEITGLGPDLRSSLKLDDFFRISHP